MTTPAPLHVVLSGPAVLAAPVLLTAAVDPAVAAGAIIGRLLVPIVGVVLLVAGLRQRGRARAAGDPRATTGRGLIIGGCVVLVLAVASFAAQAGLAAGR